MSLFMMSIYVTVSSRKTIAQAQQPAQTVEQTRKNIQVLEGLPESQLFLLMNFVAVSLGERCEFCHVNKGKDPKTGQTVWVWESDEKPEKLAGRRMMQMVLLINGSNKVDFRENSVTCYTCHRGQTTPVGLPSMPLTKSGHEAAPSETVPTAPATRPTVDEIFARYLQAVGGANITSTRSLVMKGKREATQNRTWPTEITFAAPDRYLVVATPSQLVVKQILNGEKGWVLNGANLRTLAPADVAEARRGWEEIFGVIKVKRTPGLQYAGIEKIDGRDTYVVAQSTPERTVSFNFEVATGVLVRKKTVRHTAVLPIPEQIDFSDYREVDGIKLPFLIRSSAIDTYDSWTRTFSEIKRNVAVDDSWFVAPVVPEKKQP